MANMRTISNLVSLELIASIELKKGLKVESGRELVWSSVEHSVEHNDSDRSSVLPS